MTSTVIDPVELVPGTSLTCWAMALPDGRLYPGTARPMPDKVDYRFRNGWVDTGDLPCREALKAELPVRTVARPEGPFEDVFAGLDGPDCDFSQFCFRPTLIARAFQTRLIVDRAGPARLRIATCGGVRLWLDEAPLAVFEPFERNSPRSIDITVDLPAGEGLLTLRLEDLHERDTTCFFALSYLDGPPARTRLPLAVDAGGLARAAHVLAGLRTAHVFHEAGQARLVADPAPDQPITLTVEGLGPFLRGGLSVAPDAAQRLEVTLGPDVPSAPIFDVANTPHGCLSIAVTAHVGAACLTRRLGTTNLPPGTELRGDLAERKAQAAALMMSGPGFEPTLALTLAIAGKRPDRLREIVEAALITIEERHDCSDFTILPLLRLWRDARSALSQPMQDRLRTAILTYRYWLTESGDDVMWFWSENHVLCFHVAQLVAGELFSDEVFANSGRTGGMLADEALSRLERWFASIEEDGLCEWNSAAYYPIDLLGLFTLYDMAPALAGKAAALMDQLFVMTGLHTSAGVPAGTQGRCYEKELLAGPSTELGSVAAIAFGGTFRPGYDRAAGLFCLSDYAPPPQASWLCSLEEGNWIEARYSQGLGAAGKLSLWKSATGQLSTVTDLGTGGQGHQAQVVDVQMAGHPMARLWINHPGELKVWGERRPSLLAGNHIMPRVAQYGSIALLVYDLDREWSDIGFTQLFAAPEAFDGQWEHAGWQIVSSGKGHAGVWCSRPLAGVDGLYRDALFRAHGMRTGWIVAMSLPGEDRAAFGQRLSGAAPEFDEAGRRVSVTAPDGRRLSLPFDAPLAVGGQDAPFDALQTTPYVGLKLSDLKDWRTLDV
ncbi:MAG: hypothetical protein P8N72_06770 [Flavimaricola sp.]|nr:hypothetical protein [Flavimaricola sp.]